MLRATANIIPFNIVYNKPVSISLGRQVRDVPIDSLVRSLKCHVCMVMYVWSCIMIVRLLEHIIKGGGYEGTQLTEEELRIEPDQLHMEGLRINGNK